MKQLNQEQMQEVNGGILFMAVPMWFAYGVIAGELAIIHSLAK
jgi:bacteriocin-like protein